MNRRILCLAAGLLTLAMPLPAKDLQPRLPKLLVLGSHGSIAGRKSARLCNELQAEYDNAFESRFIDALREARAAKPYHITRMPTQIFLDGADREIFRHEGFLGKKDILAKWRELGYDFTPKAGIAAGGIERWKPAGPEPAPDSVCALCGKTVGPKTRTVVKTAKGSMTLCSPRCACILLACLAESQSAAKPEITFTDWETGKPVPADRAVFLYLLEARSGRPVIRVYGSQKEALAARAAAGGSIVAFDALRQKVRAVTCAFCNRPMAPEKASRLQADGIGLLACSPRCALAVAVRAGMNMDIRQPDALTGEPIRIAIRNGAVTAVQPETAVVWTGMRKDKNGNWTSAGCFHQAAFVSPYTLKKWLAMHPRETGRQTTFQKLLKDLENLSPARLKKSCRPGICGSAAK